jgi:hypothetical protein
MPLRSSRNIEAGNNIKPAKYNAINTAESRMKTAMVILVSPKNTISHPVAMRYFLHQLVNLVL